MPDTVTKIDEQTGAIPAEPEKPKKFHSYQASANAFGGHLVRPVKSNLPTLASSCLPSVGGYHSARHDNFQFHELVSIDQAYTHVGGSYNRDDGSWTTIASSVIKGLNVGHTLFADLIVGQISLKHLVDGTSEVSFLGTSFKNLRIGHHDLAPRLLLSLCDDVGKGSIFGEASPFLTKVRKQSYNFMSSWRELDPTPTPPAPPKTAVPEDGDNGLADVQRRGSVVCSIVEGFGPETEQKNKPFLPETEQKDKPFLPWPSYGHAIKIPHFGYVFLGELTVRPGSFDLTMIRLDLGSPIQGGASGAQANVAGATKGGPSGPKTGP